LQHALGETRRVEVSDGRLVLLASDGSTLAELVHPTVTARIELPSSSMVAGTTMNGRVVVDNQTGHVIDASGCGSLFAVALGSDGYRPDVPWRLCLQDLDIPTGESSYPVAVSATALGCVGGPPTDGIPSCTPSGPPPLPPGTYEAKLYQSTHVVPDPPPVPVTVVGAGDETNGFSASDLERELVDAGFDVTHDGTAPGSPLAATAEMLCVNGTQLRVYEHADDGARRVVSDSISTDGSTIARGNSRVIVDWIGPPHFFARGRVIALILQDDTELLDTLTRTMGPTLSPDAPQGARATAPCG
jgi:hypothetical protein